MTLIWIEVVGKKGPHTKPDKLRGGQHGGLTNSDTSSHHVGWSDAKAF